MALDERMSVPRLRSDARANQQKVLEAARAVFAERGVDASLEEVARRAGVGIATLYRRFPTREDLVIAAFLPKMLVWVDAIEVALGNPDPCRAFPDYVTSVFDLQFQDRGFSDVLAMDFPMSQEIEAARLRGITGFGELVQRAQSAGCLRPEFTPEDLLIFLMANAGVISAGGANARVSSDRLLAYLLQAAAASVPSDLPRSPTPDEILQAMRRFPHADQD
ncbi:MAG: helix-turn-helix domain containing protein [Candidatus Nanopelagicales bacterium]|nr:helix-turn-helix domain containing protein [Candidatus Nanopelagicales bacterium]